MSQTFTRILCPVDLSSFSLDALKLAVTLAETNDARLDVLHVVHNPFDEIYMSAITQTDPAMIEAYARAGEAGQNPARDRRALGSSAQAILS